MAVPIKIYNSGGQQVATTGTGTATNPVQSSGSLLSDAENYGKDLWDLTPGGIGGNLGKLGSKALGNNPITTAGSDLTDLSKVATFVTDPSNWLRVGEVIGGGLLMILGVIAVAFTLGGKNISEAAKYVIPSEIVGQAIKSRNTNNSRGSAQGKHSTIERGQAKGEHA